MRNFHRYSEIISHRDLASGATCEAETPKGYVLYVSLPEAIWLETERCYEGCLRIKPNGKPLKYIPVTVRFEPTAEDEERIQKFRKESEYQRRNDKFANADGWVSPPFQGDR